jgi:hypothetical protein
MPLIFEYENGREESLASYELAYRDSYASARASHRYSVAFWSGLLVMGAYLGLKAGEIFLACIFATTLCYHLYQSIPYSRVFWRTIDTYVGGESTKRIKLEVTADGLHETVEAIQSIVPWSAVRSFTRFRDTLFIELAANLRAIVPQRSLSASSPSIEELAAVLRDHGIKETPSLPPWRHRR